MRQRKRLTNCFTLAAIGITAALGLTGCEKKDAQAGVVAPPATVTVAQPIRREIADFKEFSGNALAYNSVVIRARVKGFLRKICFTEGTVVKQGDLLYEIDPEQFQADVDRSKATLQGAQARLEKAKADLAIKQEMAAGNAASKLDVIQAQASVDTSSADVASARADLDLADLNLGYTKIRSPITGRIANTQVDVGNLVGADGNTELTTVVQWEPIYVEFNVDEASMQEYKDRLKEKGVAIPEVDKSNVPLLLALGDSDDFIYKGRIDFVDNTVDKSTGTLKVRGVLPNADRMIAPGYFCRVRIPNGEPYEALLVPERAIAVDQGQKYLLAVNDKNEVEYRPIVTGPQQGRLRVIKKGITADDWVIVEGLLRTRPGATVAPERKPLAALELTPTSGPSLRLPATQPATTQSTP